MFRKKRRYKTVFVIRRRPQFKVVGNRIGHVSARHFNIDGQPGVDLEPAAKPLVVARI